MDTPNFLCDCCRSENEYDDKTTFVGHMEGKDGRPCDEEVKLCFDCYKASILGKNKPAVWIYSYPMRFRAKNIPPLDIPRRGLSKPIPMKPKTSSEISQRILSAMRDKTSVDSQD